MILLLIINAGFPLGRIVATPNALQALTPEDIETGLRRHSTGDWGALGLEDKAANDRALLDGTRIFSAGT